MSVSFDRHELLGIEDGVTPLDLIAIGVVCATVGYLIGFHHLTGSRRLDQPRAVGIE